MKITQSPSGKFFKAVHECADGKVITIYDRDRHMAIRRLACLIWPMPPANYFTEDVSAVRSRPKTLIQQKG